jgi:hypothetical protein
MEALPERLRLVESHGDQVEYIPLAPPFYWSDVEYIPLLCPPIGPTQWKSSPSGFTLWSHTVIRWSIFPFSALLVV